MLVIGRSVGKEVMIGDHSIVTVASINQEEVRLGFDTLEEVKRVDTPAMVMEAARVKARASQSIIGRTEPMKRLPVYIGIREIGEGQIDIRASLRLEMVNIKGYTISPIDEKTSLGPSNHEFLVIRANNRSEARAIKKLVNHGLLNWRWYEEVEEPDASVYCLYVRKTKDKGEGDVRYVDLSAVPSELAS